jgi:glycosyltransferase involved in cell wall biosynthesis
MITKKHTIAFYCSSISWGGLEMNTVRYASWMHELGYHVIVYAVADTPLYIDAVRSGLDVKLVRRNRKYFDGINALRIARAFAQDNVSVCWFRDTRDMDVLGWAKRFSGGSFKLLYHQAMQFGVSKKDAFHTLRFKPVDAWVSTLDFLKEQVIASTNFDASKIHVVPLGVDAERLKATNVTRESARNAYGITVDAVLFGLIGRIDPLKGQHVAIEALHILHERGLNYHLLLVGEATHHEGDGYIHALESLIAKHGLESFVHVRPYSQDVSVFYSAIDTFLLCSKGETFGTVTVEAMACSLPIIGTQSSGTPELLHHGECGILVTPESPALLADAMEEIIANHEEARVMGARALARFNQFYSKKASLQGMDEIVTNLLRKD